MTQPPTRQPLRPSRALGRVSGAVLVTAGLFALIAETLPVASQIDPLHAQNLVAPRGRSELGRTLFSDPRLFGDGSTSCASCHQAARSWTDGEPLAAGYPGVALLSQRAVRG